MCGIKDFKSVSKNEKCCLCRLTFVLCFVISTALIIGGFFVPPTGVIDGSVLTAVGELIAFPALLYGFRALELGYELKFQHGETSVELHREEEEA
jgi:hypothetical protein